MNDSDNINYPRMVDEQKRALEEEIAEFQRRKVGKVLGIQMIKIKSNISCYILRIAYY